MVEERYKMPLLYNLTEEEMLEVYKTVEKQLVLNNYVAALDEFLKSSNCGYTDEQKTVIIKTIDLGVLAQNRIDCRRQAEDMDWGQIGYDFEIDDIREYLEFDLGIKPGEGRREHD